jgi:hypothetical protein
MYASGGTELAIFQDAGIWCWDGFRFVYSANARSLGKPGTPVPFATGKETASQAAHRIAAGEAGEAAAQAGASTRAAQAEEHSNRHGHGSKAR